MIISILLTIEIVICAVFSLYALYFLFFSIMSRRKLELPENTEAKTHKFAVIFPAYGEDNVILNSVTQFLNQDYPQEMFQTIVISDHMKDETNEQLQQMHITLAVAQYANSTKAKALNLAMEYIDGEPDYILILDADNIVENTFLTDVNKHLNANVKAVQAHRTAKHINTAIENYDAVSEEINNSIFSTGHVASGLPSRLIGSGMVFDTQWFRKSVTRLNTAGEDKELEILLLKDNIFTYYLPDIHVYDEKVSNVNGYFKQRRRWIGAQFHSFNDLTKETSVFTESRSINWKIVDKVFQFLLPPRLIMLGLPFFFFLISIFVLQEMMICWAIVTLSFIAACMIGAPKNISLWSILKTIIHLPTLFTLTAINFFKPKGDKAHFIHTKHG